MEHLKQETMSGAQLNLDALYQVCPQCFTESKDPKTGEIKHTVDFEKLRLLLGDNIAEGDERYDFTWVGKRAALQEAAKPIRKTLRPCPEESVDWDNTKNLYIEGDNLEVLKLLQNSYMGKVKMIYIDPPYNTGNDFVYQDDFHQTKQDFDLFSGDVTDEGERLVKNTESNGRFHSDWCSMIYSRLMVARSLLKEDGVIFISIDDNEVENLRKIGDEIFSESNFVAQLVWEQGRKSMAAQVAINHEYCLIYAKNRSYLIDYDNSVPNRNWQTYKKGLDKIYAEVDRLKALYGSNVEEIEKGLAKFYKSLPDDDPAKAQSHYKKFDPCLGIYHPDNISQGTGKGGRFPIIHPVTGKPCKVPGGGWRFSESKLPELLRENRIAFGKDETTVPCLKRFLKETEYEVFASVFYRDGRGASKRLDMLMGDKLFDYPKDEEIIKLFISLVTSYDKADALVLDFFSGSATTAHAVFQLNAEDGGNRKFILVQLPEKTEEDSQAFKAGYHDICEIGKERIRRAGKKIKEGQNVKQNDLFSGDQEPIDIGFRVFKCADSNMKDVYYTPAEYSQELLLGLEDNIKEDRNDLDLLFGCMLDWGVTLDLPLRTEKVDGVTIHIVNEGDLVACFDQSIPETAIDRIASLHPMRVVLRDNCFKEAKEKMNFFEIFKQRTGWSEDEVRKNVKVI